MIRGVNKKVIEVQSTNNEYFERAILFVKDSKKIFDEKELKKRADEYIFTINPRNNSKPLSTKVVAQNTPSPDDPEEKIFNVIKMVASAIVGALIMAIVFLIIT